MHTNTQLVTGPALARLIGVSPATIQNFVTDGLLTPAAELSDGTRIFQPRDVARARELAAMPRRRKRKTPDPGRGELIVT